MNRLERLKEFYKQKPEDGFVLFALAKEYENMGNDAEALVFYQKTIEHAPNDIGTYYHLAKLYERTENPTKASEIYQQGIELAKKIGDRHALSELQNAYMNMDID